MQLHVARLCLDCQEIHAASRCPACSSETFAPVSRWIPAQERRARLRPTEPEDTVDSYRRLLTPPAEAKDAARWPKRIAILVAAASVGGWLWQRPRRAAENEDGR
jgi:hypothetical protein